MPEATLLTALDLKIVWTVFGKWVPQCNYIVTHIYKI